MAAPLPSPTAGQERQQYLGNMDAPALEQRMAQEQQAAALQAQHYQQYYQQQQAYAAAQQQRQAYAMDPQQEAQHPNGGQSAYQPDRSGAGATAQETARYISDYGLVAEAAKRAQMAVLTRDLEGVELR